MRNKFKSIRSLWLKTVYLIVCTLLSANLSASNPDIAPWMVNLSRSLSQDGFDNKTPEIIVKGNTIHVVWIEEKYQTSCNVYYCRSTDLGKSWEKPIAVQKLTDNDYALSPETRKLAVDGNNVHICTPDYDYSAGGIGKIYYSRSTNGGASFEPSREIVTTGGGYRHILESQVRAAGGKVAVAFFGEGSKNGLRVLFSADAGTSYHEKLITEEPNGLADLWFDGNQIILVSEYVYYYYGLNVGKVFVSVSNDNATTFITNKVSTTFNESPTVVREKCRCYHDIHYSPKIAKSGNYIHILFSGYNEKQIWTALYARSTDNGLTFQKAVDINNNVLAGNGFQGGQEAIASLNGNVYISFLSTGGKVFFASSSDNGASFTTARNIMSDGFSHIETTWWISMLADPSDQTGKTVYLTGNSLFSLKSTDGGKTFGSATIGAPGFSVSDIIADMTVDGKGQRHWICEAKWKGGSTRDIFYRGLLAQPSPGNMNKALKIQTQYNNPAVFDLTIVPSSTSLQFDSALTAEAWVKLIPVTNNGSVNILGKVNGYDGYDYSPNGFQMGFRYGNGAFAINSGIETDKGDFVNWGPGNIKDTLWHHIAFTYDANDGLENYKTYVDGLLVAKQTVTGTIIKGDGLLMIGSRSQYYQNALYYVDDIRLWNRALSQKELLANQQRKSFTGDSHLKMNLTFDDTFKDISGNGNDAIPLNRGEITTSDFDPPVPTFDFYRLLNEVTFQNKTVNGGTWLWDFGNKTTSTQNSPKCSYPSAGEYTVSLTASNKTTAAAAIGKVTIEGLNHIEPISAGNSGYCTLLVYGGGLKVSGTTVTLKKTGEANINGENLSSPATGVLSAEMKLEGAALGKWDVVVKSGTAELVLKDAFEVVKAVVADPWVSIAGRGAILFNRWQPYTLNFGNNGNVDAHSVPVWFAITDDENLEVEFIDFRMVVSDLATQKGIAASIQELGPFFRTDMVLDENMKARVYPFMIPNIPAKSSGSIHIRIKTAKSFQMKVWANPPWVEVAPAGKSASRAGASSQAKLKTAECVMGVLAEGIVDIGTSAIPGVGCLWAAGKWGYQIGTTPPWDKKFSLMNTLWNSITTVVDCGINLSGAGAIYKGIGVFMSNMGQYASSYKQCLELLKTNGNQSMGVSAVSSFDPNEIAGPKGYGSENWIRKNSLIPYCIQFENKSTATAPAHTVTITDTLDMATFNLPEFGFSQFGWGDTIVSPPGKLLKEFSMDIDLRPGKKLITRVSAKLDTIKGIVYWNFSSLNPATMEPEEDPFSGFLPPNNSQGAGEGFVSYSVGLKPELKTGAKIKNRAVIVFDSNQPILTNEYMNTLDIDPPQSSVLPLEATTDSRFPVIWSGNDSGSGIAGYSVFVLENDTLLRPWLLNTRLTTSDFEGRVGSKYKFYSLATDNVSLTEKETGYDAQTTVTVHSEEFDLVREELQLFPNPATGKLHIRLTNAPCGIYAVELIRIDGYVQHSELYPDLMIQQGITLDLTGCNPGSYVVRVVYGDRNIVRKVMIR
jgi:PKD repeat protein